MDSRKKEKLHLRVPGKLLLLLKGLYGVRLSEMDGKKLSFNDFIEGILTRYTSEDDEGMRLYMAYLEKRERERVERARRKVEKGKEVLDEWDV